MVTLKQAEMVKPKQAEMVTLKQAEMVKPKQAEMVKLNQCYLEWEKKQTTWCIFSFRNILILITTQR